MARLFSRKVALMSTFNAVNVSPNFPQPHQRIITSKGTNGLIEATAECSLQCWHFFFHEIISYLDAIY